MLQTAGSEMFNHCGQSFKPKDIWYLANTKECYDRVLYISFCPKCLKDIVCLMETVKSKDKDMLDKTYCKIKQGNKALKEIELCRPDKLYTAQDIKIKKGKPCGWTFGENIEIHNNKGEVVAIRQKRCDYYGQKEIIKQYSVAN